MKYKSAQKTLDKLSHKPTIFTIPRLFIYLFILYIKLNIYCAFLISFEKIKMLSTCHLFNKYEMQINVIKIYYSYIHLLLSINDKINDLIVDSIKIYYFGKIINLIFK